MLLPVFWTQRPVAVVVAVFLLEMMPLPVLLLVIDIAVVLVVSVVFSMPPCLPFSSGLYELETMIIQLWFSERLTFSRYLLLMVFVVVDDDDAVVVQWDML